MNIQVSKDDAHFAAVLTNDGSVEWIDFPSLRRRVEATELLERWLKGDVEGVYLGRRVESKLASHAKGASARAGGG